MNSGVAILFDLDGTLTDSKPGIMNCLRQAMDVTHSPYDGPLDRFIGPPTETWPEHLLPGGDEASHQLFITTYRACYDREGWAQNSVYDGIPELLTSLQEQGVALYVCTSKPERFALRILAKFDLERYFKAIYGDRPESDHKKTTLMAELLRTEKLEPGAAWMVGDRHYDMTAAKNNGVHTLGALWGYGSAEELTESGAEVLCPKPADVLNAVLCACR